ncbi:hypothetical protein SB717_35070, partial [Priestia sp. SIMBA_032]
MRAFVVIAMIGCLSACSMAPKLERPIPPVPASFPGSGNAAMTQGNAVPPNETGWRTMFVDP